MKSSYGWRSSRKRIMEKKWSIAFFTQAERYLYDISHRNDDDNARMRRNVSIGIFKLREYEEWASIEWMRKRWFFHTFDIYLPW